jgi:hypothetical protein
MDDITVAQGRWLATRLAQLSDKQIDDAFRAANYSADEIKLLRQGVRDRQRSLIRLRGPRFAERNSNDDPNEKSTASMGGAFDFDRSAV